MVLSGLMLINCLFLCAVFPVWTILMVKVVYKVYAEDGVNHGGRTCCNHVNVGCFKCSKYLFHCDLKVNEELVSLWLAF